MSESLKYCGGCSAWLNREAFARNRAAKDGLQTRCKSCNARWAREHRPRKMEIAPPTAPDEKWCRRCRLVKPLTDFGVHASSSDRKQTYCRKCFADIYRERRERAGHVVRPAAVPEGHKFCRGCERILPFADWALRSSTKDGLAFRCKACMSAKDKAKHLERTYGMTVDELESLLAEQDGRCAICRTAAAVHVDHDHVTCEIRGLLCFRCNAALGQFGDDPIVLRQAARYLEQARPGIPADSTVIDIRTRLSGSAATSRIEQAWREGQADFGTAT